MEDLKKYDEDFFLFLEVGFIAINQADEDSAVKLLKTCELLRPEQPLIKIGFGYLHLHKLELKPACQCFEEVLQKYPNNEMAQAFLGIALSLTPDQVTKGEQILEKTLKSSSDSQIKKVAHSTLDFIDHFIKKTPGPAEVKRKS